MPRKFKKRRMMTGTNGEGMGWEEYYDYQFPDDETKPANLKILEMAQKWKKKGAGEDALGGFNLGGVEGREDGNSGGGGGIKRKQAELGGAGDVDSQEIQLEEVEGAREDQGGEGARGGDRAGTEPELSKRKLNGGEVEELEGEEEEEEESERGDVAGGEA